MYLYPISNKCVYHIYYIVIIRVITDLPMNGGVRGIKWQ